MGLMNSLVYANEENVNEAVKQKADSNGLAMTLGIGSLYAGAYGIAVEYYFFNTRLNHFSLHGAAGYDNTVMMKKSIFSYAATLRYGLGTGDRLILDLTYGKVATLWESSWSYNIVTHQMKEWETEKNIYAPSISVGYQRMSRIGLIFFCSVGASYITDKEYTLGNNVFERTFSIGTGYKIF